MKTKKKSIAAKLAVCASLLIACTMGATSFAASAATGRDYVSAFRSEAESAQDALKRAN